MDNLLLQLILFSQWLLKATTRLFLSLTRTHTRAASQVSSTSAKKAKKKRSASFFFSFLPILLNRH